MKATPQISPLAENVTRAYKLKWVCLQPQLTASCQMHTSVVNSCKLLLIPLHVTQMKIEGHPQVFSTKKLNAKHSYSRSISC